MAELAGMPSSEKDISQDCVTRACGRERSAPTGAGQLPRAVSTEAAKRQPSVRPDGDCPEPGESRRRNKPGRRPPSRGPGAAGAVRGLPGRLHLRCPLLTGRTGSGGDRYREGATLQVAKRYQFGRTGRARDQGPTAARAASVPPRPCLDSPRARPRPASPWPGNVSDLPDVPEGVPHHRPPIAVGVSNGSSSDVAPAASARSYTASASAT